MTAHVWCPNAQYYENEKLRCLLDLQAFACRGLPEKLYTDQGKIFTCSHLRVVCANLRIHLLHARPYAPPRRVDRMRSGKAIYAGGGVIWQVLSDGKSSWRTQQVSSPLRR